MTKTFVALIFPVFILCCHLFSPIYANDPILSLINEADDIIPGVVPLEISEPGNRGSDNHPNILEELIDNKGLNSNTEGTENNENQQMITNPLEIEKKVEETEGPEGYQESPDELLKDLINIEEVKGIDLAQYETFEEKDKMIINSLLIQELSSDDEKETEALESSLLPIDVLSESSSSGSFSMEQNKLKDNIEALLENDKSTNDMENKEESQENGVLFKEVIKDSSLDFIEQENNKNNEIIIDSLKRVENNQGITEETFDDEKQEGKLSNLLEKQIEIEIKQDEDLEKKILAYSLRESLEGSQTLEARTNTQPRGMENSKPQNDIKQVGSVKELEELGVLLEDSLGSQGLNLNLENLENKDEEITKDMNNDNAYGQQENLTSADYPEYKETEPFQFIEPSKIAENNEKLTDGFELLSMRTTEDLQSPLDETQVSSVAEDSLLIGLMLGEPSIDFLKVEEAQVSDMEMTSELDNASNKIEENVLFSDQNKELVETSKIPNVLNEKVSLESIDDEDCDCDQENILGLTESNPLENSFSNSKIDDKDHEVLSSSNEFSTTVGNLDKLNQVLTKMKIEHKSSILEEEIEKAKEENLQKEVGKLRKVSDEQDIKLNESDKRVEEKSNDKIKKRQKDSFGEMVFSKNDQSELNYSFERLPVMIIGIGIIMILYLSMKMTVNCNKQPKMEKSDEEKEKLLAKGLNIY